MVTSVVDHKVRAVVQNWLPRFLANELDYLDVQRTLDAIETWEDWPVEWSNVAREYEDRGEDALSRGQLVTAGLHLRRAALTLQFAQFVATEDERQREEIHRKQVAIYGRAARFLLPPAERVDLPGELFTASGYFRMPAQRQAVGAVVLIPGLESTKEQFTTLEPHFLARGLATLSLEGPGQGETWYQTPFRDHLYGQCMRRAGEFLDDRCPAIPRAVLGTSFGGYLALRHAAALPGLAAVVDLAGPYDVTDFDRLQDVTRQSLRHFVGAESDIDAKEMLASVNLSGALSTLSVPALVVHGDQDTIIFPTHAERIAEGLPKLATLWMISGGNHGCNNVHTWLRPAVADWTAERLRSAVDRSGGEP